MPQRIGFQKPQLVTEIVPVLEQKLCSVTAWAVSPKRLSQPRSRLPLSQQKWTFAARLGTPVHVGRLGFSLKPTHRVASGAPKHVVSLWCPSFPSSLTSTCPCRSWAPCWDCCSFHVSHPFNWKKWKKAGLTLTWQYVCIYIYLCMFTFTFIYVISCRITIIPMANHQNNRIIDLVDPILDSSASPSKGCFNLFSNVAWHIFYTKPSIAVRKRDAFENWFQTKFNCCMFTDRSQ